MPLNPTLERSTPENFISALRRATAFLHEELERAPLSTALLRNDATIDDYIAYLKKMEAVIRFSDETLLPRLQAVLPDAGEGRKSDWVRSDLAHFGIAAETSTTLFQPLISTTTAAALGFFYVVEGSTLGGRVLLKRLKPLLRDDAEAGSRFLNGYGAETAVRWKDFLKAFGDYAVANDCEEEVIGAAQEAFRSIHRHFNS